MAFYKRAPGKTNHALLSLFARADQSWIRLSFVPFLFKLKRVVIALISMLLELPGEPVIYKSVMYIQTKQSTQPTAALRPVTP